MTHQQIALVRETFAKVLPIQEAAAEMFYARLFELDPNVKLLFKSDLKERGRKLMAMIATAVAGLDRLDEIVPAAQALGARHVGDVSPTATTTRWRRPCCGRSREAWARLSRPRSRPRGRPATAWWRQR